MRTRTCAYQEVRIASFSENFAYILCNESSPVDIFQLKTSLSFIKTRSQYTKRIEYLKKKMSEDSLERQFFHKIFNPTKTSSTLSLLEEMFRVDMVMFTK